MNCSYSTGLAEPDWENRLNDNQQDCDKSDCCYRYSCQDSCDVSSIFKHFINAVERALRTDYEKQSRQKYGYVITIDCSNHKGQIFVDNDACEHLQKGQRPTEDHVLSSCHCFCPCQQKCNDKDGSSECKTCDCYDIYCTLADWSPETKTKTVTLKPSTTTEKFATTLKPSTTTEKFATTLKPSMTTEKFATTLKASMTTEKFATTLKPSMTTEKFATKLKPSTTTEKFATTLKASTTTENVTTTTVDITATASNAEGVSSAAIGGGVGGVIFLLVVAVLLMIFIRRRRSRREMAQNNHHNHNGAFCNSAYNQAEVNMNSTNTLFNTDTVIVPNGRGRRQQLIGNTDEHKFANTSLPDRQQNYVQVNNKSTKSFVENSDYEFAKPEGNDDDYFELQLESNKNSNERLRSQQNQGEKTQSLSVKDAVIDNYEFAKPVPINNDENYFELEPQSHEYCDVKAQQNCVENYFVLEKDNQSNGAGNIDDVYNTLNENMKTNDDDNKDEYHHLRDITRSGREGTNHVDDDADDYDMLKNGAKGRESPFNDDYDHCKPKRVPNGEDDYDHFT